jgi:hypothetical protein
LTQKDDDKIYDSDHRQRDEDPSAYRDRRAEKQKREDDGRDETESGE